MTSASQPTSVLHVRLAGVTLGLPASAVREIVRAVAITPLPSAPSVIEGVVNVRGELVPVVDVRRRLGLVARRLDPGEFLVLLWAGTRTIALRVEDVDDIADLATTDVAPAGDVSPSIRGLAGIAAQEGGALVLYDPLAFVTQAEAVALDAALAEA